MSLEALLTEITAALKENSALLAIANSTRAEALAAITSAEGEKGTTTTRTRRTKEQIAADTASAAATPTVVTKPATPPVVAEPVYPTVEELRATATKYALVTGDEKVRRTAFLKAVIEEVGISENAEGKRLITAAAPEDRAKIIGWLEAFAAGKTVNFQADNDEPPASEDDDIG